MCDFDAINEALNSEERQTIDVKIVRLGGQDVQTIEAGMTVADFKAKYGLEGTKLVSAEGDILRNSDVLREDMKVFVSTPKKNG